jgi:Gas vesicle synthesis protein GvpO
MTHGRKHESGYVPRQARQSDERVNASLVSASRTAMHQLSTLTSLPTEGISRLEQDDDGWLFHIEVVELERIPDSTSVLASYETHTDEEGNVMSYKRTRRYTRNQAGEL